MSAIALPRRLRRRDRQLPERGRLPAAAARVARDAALALPALRPQIAAYDNIPVVSWIVLRGRCRRCDAPISVRYPIVEALTAALFVAVGADIGLEPELMPGAGARRHAGGRRRDRPRAPGSSRTGSRRPRPIAAVRAVGRGRPVPAAREPDRGRGRRRPDAAGRRSPIRPGWGWATSSSPAVMGLFLGRVGRAGAVHRLRRRGAGRDRRSCSPAARQARKQGVPFGPFLALGGIVGAAVRPRASSTGTRHLRHQRLTFLERFTRQH